MRKNIHLILFMLCIFLVIRIHELKAQTNSELLRSKLESYIQDFMQWYAIPGLSIAVLKDKEVVFAKGYGVKSIKTKEKIAPETVFSTASVTKLFVAAAVMQLVEKGVVDLNAPVVKYLPYFKLNDERYKKITVKQMLQHKSGMPDITAKELYSSWRNPEYDDRALENYVRSLKNESLVAEPGEAYLYSNMAFDVLGDMIAKVSGKSFEDYIKENILKPLKMTESTVLYRELNEKRLASPHELQNDLKYAVSDLFPYTRKHPACGTLFSNVVDMSHWALAHMNRGEFDGIRILKESSYDIMWNPSDVLTWLSEEISTLKVLSHAGGDPGFRTEFFIVPEEGLGVIVMTNCWEFEIQPVALKALNIFSGKDDKDWFTYFHGILWKSIREEGVSETINNCRMLIDKYGMDVFHPAILNQHGRLLCEFNRLSDACELFKFNVNLYPKIFQLYNFLAECYWKMGKTDLALENYKKSLELKPGNETAVKMLKKIQKKKK